MKYFIQAQMMRIFLYKKINPYFGFIFLNLSRNYDIICDRIV